MTGTRIEKLNEIMSVRFIASFMLLVFLTTSCQKEYMEEPTEEGVNNHSFVMDGEKWARTGYVYTPGRPSPAEYHEVGENLRFHFHSYNITDDEKYCDVDMRIYFKRDTIQIPYEISLKSYDEYEIWKNPKGGYLKMGYKKDESSNWQYFTEVISSSLLITRFDTIIAGTFNAVVIDNEGKFEINKGKFDYKLTEVHE